MIPIGNAARRVENKKSRKGERVLPRKKERSIPRQSKLPKKPRFEPRTKIIAGNHEPVFKRASEI